MVFQLQLSCILKQSILQQNSQRVNFDVVRNGKRPIAYHFFFFFSMKFEYKIYQFLMIEIIKSKCVYS